MLNDRGDVLLPLEIDPAYLKGRALSVGFDDSLGDRRRAGGRGSQARLTVVRLDAAVQASPSVRARAPSRRWGRSVLMISPARRAARVAVWAGGQDDNAILFNRDGEVAGILRNGHGLHA